MLRHNGARTAHLVASAVPGSIVMMYLLHCHSDILLVLNCGRLYQSLHLNVGVGVMSLTNLFTYLIVVVYKDRLLCMCIHVCAYICYFVYATCAHLCTCSCVYILTTLDDD